ncbi:MAG TPA: universal stress protein [Dehalococcoidia bacterium]|nr:universal stress protein [Dehalococcoidia bacterium]
MFKRILVPLDGSQFAEQVLPYAEILAKPDQMSVTLLRVVEPMSYKVVAASRGIPADQARASMEAYSQEYLEQVAASFREQGMPVLAKVLEGAVAGCIVDEGSNEPGTLIVMSTHGRSGIGRWVFGSVTNKVLQTATNPLLIVHSTDEPISKAEIAIKRIIVPLDGSELAEQVLPWAEILAQGMKAEVELFQVIEPILPEAADVLRGIYPRDINVELRKQAEEYLEGIARPLRERGLSVCSTVEEGDPPSRILEAGGRQTDALIAMSTHGRSGIARWVLGSVTDKVIHSTASPLLIVRCR